MSQPFVYRLSSISNASLDRYPNNRITKFIHHLPETLFFDKSKHYVIQLLSFCLSSKRLPSWRKPAYIRLHLAQLDCNSFAAPERVRCLAQLILPNHAEDNRGEEEKHTNLDWFELLNPTPLILDKTLFSLSELEFTFTDEKNKELELQDGPPTILNCVIEEMSDIERFCLTVNPSQGRHKFPTNTDVDFRVSFGSPITHTTKWEVALHSIIIPSNIRVIGEMFGYSMVVIRDGQEKKLSRRLKNIGQTAGDFVKRVTRDGARYGIYINQKDRHHFTIGFDGSIAKSIQFDPSLCRLFNIPTYSSRTGVIFHAEDEGSGASFFPMGNSFDKSRTITPNEQIVLFADIVQSSIMGDERAPLVDILSTVRLGMLENTTNSDTLYTVTLPTYRPVSKAFIKDIHVKICDIHGNLAEFQYNDENERTEMQFVFVFRK